VGRGGGDDLGWLAGAEFSVRCNEGLSIGSLALEDSPRGPEPVAELGGEDPNCETCDDHDGPVSRTDEAPGTCENAEDKPTPKVGSAVATVDGPNGSWHARGTSEVNVAFRSVVRCNEG